MSKINNIRELRGKLLDTIQDLESGKIEIQDAIAMQKLGDTIISTLKSEMQYSILIDSKPHIPFFGEQTNESLPNKGMKKIL